MELIINGKGIDKYNEVKVNLKYDSIADTFSFSQYFDPENPNPNVKTTFKPGAYYECAITHRGVLLMKGTVLSHKLSSSANPPRQLVSVSGYTKTGILHDCQIVIADVGTVIDGNANPIDVPESSVQFDNLTLLQIAEKVCAYYNITVIVDPELNNDTSFSAPYPTLTAKRDQSVEDFLDGLCTQKNLILSHTPQGELLITRVKSDKLLTTSVTRLEIINPTSFTNELSGAPQQTVSDFSRNSVDRAILFDFSDPGTWIDMSLGFDGQQMHRIVQVEGQDTGTNAPDSACVNPYVPATSTRFKRVIQSSGSDNDTPLTARAIVGAELKSIPLVIKIEGWELNGHLVTPNQMITVVNPEVYLYRTTKFIIQEVEFNDNPKETTATLTCVLPECYNTDPIVNVFE